MVRRVIRIILSTLAVVVLIACQETSDVTPATEVDEVESDAQESLTVAFTKVSDLDDELFEVSGMVCIDGRVFAHNDSGNDTFLYELNVTDGTIIGRVDVHDALKIDWEDITQDDEYVYIGDIGNNLGSRDDLTIYKLSKQQLLEGTDVQAERISLAYADQTVFYYDLYTTPYDAEALIAYGDWLYIFTKDWAGHTTRVYSIPKEPGEYVVEQLDDVAMRSDVLITGASYDPQSGKVVLLGYNDPYHPDGLFKSELIILEGFSGDDFFSASVKSYVLSEGLIPRQFEAVSFDTEDRLYIGSEGRSTLLEAPASLYLATIVRQ